jgi:hypothetical protein
VLALQSVVAILLKATVSLQVESNVVDEDMEVQCDLLLPVELDD